jgi:hypothetical protein
MWMRVMWVLYTVLLLGACAGQTHVIMPWVDVNKTIELDVDWIIRYYDTDIISVEDMHSNFTALKDLGYSTAIILGNGLLPMDDFDTWLGDLTYAIDHMRGATDLFMMWDDPQTDEAAGLRNQLMETLTKMYPNVTFGVSVQPLKRGLNKLDYRFYDVIMGYHFGVHPWSFWRIYGDRPYVPGEQGIYDVGETDKTLQAVRKMQALAAQHNATVWFTDNAHFEVAYTTTTTQMREDYLTAVLAGVDSYGWFLFDILHESRDTYYTGDIIDTGDNTTAPDAWSRYLFLKDTLIPLANSGLLQAPQTIAQLEREIDLLEAKIDTLTRLKRFRIDIIAMASGVLIMGAIVKRHSPDRVR